MEHIVFGIVAHVDAGKTTLSERMLFESGMIRKQGSVDRRDAFLDTYAMEKARGITIYSKQAVIRLPRQQWYLIDTPGHVDFSAEMERALSVLDYAILVVSGADGIQAHTRTLWTLLEEYGVPVIVFVNKMDRDNADADRVLYDLKAEFSDRCVDFRLDKGEKCLDALSMCTEEAMEEMLETGELREETIGQMIADRQVFPVLFGSALKGEGVSKLLEIMDRYGMPSGSREDEFGARVFKVSRDPSGNRLTHLKVTGGRLEVKSVLPGNEGKVDQIRLYSGEKFEVLKEAEAGMVVCITGPENTYPGQGLGVQEQVRENILEPVLTYRMILPKGCDPVTVMMPKMRILEEENPLLCTEWDEDAYQLLVHVMGEVELEVLKNTISERFGIDVEFGEGNIIYKETIENTVEGVGHFEPLRHYAEVHLILEPLPCGSGLVFETKCSEDVLDKNWQRLILTHLKERRIRGVLTGAELTDVKITVAAGRAHPKHTEGGDFRQATYRAIRQGLMQATSTLLEPLYSFRIVVPETLVGRVMTDVEAMGGVSKPPEYMEGNRVVLKGYAPVSRMQNYYRELLAFSKGEGSMQTMNFGYAPCRDAEKIIEEKGYSPANDLRNTPDSVFCANGSGYVVPWDEVFAHMHVESVLLNAYKSHEGEENDGRSAGRTSKGSDAFLSPDEVDRIIGGISRRRSGEDREGRGWLRSAGRKRETSYGASGGSVRYEHHGSSAKKEKEKILVVDGYNVIFAWKKLKELAAVNIDAARDMLNDELCNYRAIFGGRTIVVYDAYRIRDRIATEEKYHNIEVVYTAADMTADMYIESFAHRHRETAEITVVTSDRLEQITVRSQGAYLISSAAFEQMVREAEKELMEQYREKEKNKGTPAKFGAAIVIPDEMKKNLS